MIKGLKLFSRTSNERCINLASYHSPHSLTWSWILSVSRQSGWKTWFYPYRTNGGLQWVLRLPFFAVQWNRQRPMFFRDMWARQRDERDGLRGRGC